MEHLAGAGQVEHLDQVEVQDQAEHLISGSIKWSK
jgi:hypothetical protein